jgi:hypothetical protein
MSIKSKARNIKRPAVNARKQLRRQVSLTPTNVSTNGGRTFIKKAVPFGIVPEPSHRNLGLIPPPTKIGVRRRQLPEQPKTAGAFGGCTKAERKRRFDIRKAALSTSAA